VEVSCETRNEALQLQREFGGTIESLRSNWLRRLTKQAATKPLRIGSRLLVSRTRGGPNTIVIPAEAAFGTGDHATTAMCLRMLERVTRGRAPGWSLLDAGTGSGILAIAASRLGATRVVAIENDPLACSIAQRNARANRVSNIKFRTGDVLKQKPAGKFDIITANLFSEILIAALPIWLPRLAPDGCLLFSGVLRSQERSLVRALRRNGCGAVEIKRRGKWIAASASRQ
jgi:ribosomal protein L11 methyltransferase